MLPLSSPCELCRELGLRPTDAQVRLMLRLADALRTPGAHLTLHDGRLMGEDCGGDELRAALMVVLWRVLSVPGSSAIVLAPHEEGESRRFGEAGRLAMDFLAGVCRSKDRGLAEITAIPEFSRLMFGSEPGWGVRLLLPDADLALRAARRSRTALILDAGSPQTALAGASAALEGVLRLSGGLLIRLW